MNAIFVIGDVDQNGEIDLQEFKRMMLPTSFDVVSKFRSVHKTTRDVQNAFKKFDINNDGSIDRLYQYNIFSNGFISFKCVSFFIKSFIGPMFKINQDVSLTFRQ